MRPMLTLIRREFTAFFLSPIAYVVLVLFLFGMGLLFSLMLVQLTEDGPRGVEWPMQALLGDNRFWMAFAVIPPLLTMRMFAEERGTGTLEMLLTAPIRDWQVVLAKYIAALGFCFVMWLPTLAYLPIVMNLKGWNAQIDPWPVWTSYLGVFAVGAMFLAVGLFVSSLVKSQLVAAIIGIAICDVFVLVTYLQPYVENSEIASKIFSFFTVPLHFSQDFTRGVIDSRHLILYGSVSLFCLFLTVRSLESRRWR